MEMVEMLLGCDTCRAASPTITMLRGTNDLKEPLRPALQAKLYRGLEFACPTCGATGKYEIIRVKYKGYVYDYGTGMPHGSLVLEAKKEDGELQHMAMSASHQGFSAVDYLNAIRYFKRAFGRIKEHMFLRFEAEDEGVVKFFASFSESEDLPGAHVISESFGEIQEGAYTIFGFDMGEIEDILEKAESAVAEKVRM